MRNFKKNKTFLRFVLVLVVFICYFLYISNHYGLGQGLFVTILTWSFFVLCTPIADAGFLVDFPVRLIFRIKMFYSELCIWGFAISLNLLSFLKYPEVYDKTKLLSLFYQIISHPFPFWAIIGVSAIGTFLSIKFGDDVMDAVNHSKSHYQIKKIRLGLILLLIIVAFILYDVIIKHFSLNLPL